MALLLGVTKERLPIPNAHRFLGQPAGSELVGHLFCILATDWEYAADDRLQIAKRARLT